MLQVASFIVVVVILLVVARWFQSTELVTIRRVQLGLQSGLTMQGRAEFLHMQRHVTGSDGQLAKMMYLN